MINSTGSIEVVDERTGGRWHVRGFRVPTLLEAHEAINQFCLSHRARPAKDQVITVQAQLEHSSDGRFEFWGNRLEQGP